MNPSVTITVNAVLDKVTWGAEALANIGAALGKSIGTAVDGAISDAQGKIKDFQKKHERGPDDSENTVMKLMKGYVSAMKGEKGDDDKEKAANQSAAFKKTAASLQKGVDTLTMIGHKSFDVIKQILGKLKQSSPLLQAIESLFNLAMMLFFMPLGNKLATVLLPAVLDLVDSMVDMWDELGDGGLDEIFNKAMDYGVKKFSDFFGKISDMLKNSSNGFLRALGSISGLIQKLIPMVPIMIGLAAWVIEHLPLMIGVIITLMGTIITLQFASLLASIMPEWMKAWGGGFVAVGAILSAGVGSLVGGSLDNVSKTNKTSDDMAEGGYVPARQGGTWKRLGEAGEGEYVVPERKLDDVMNARLVAGNRGTPYQKGSAGGGGFGNITNNFYINGYTDSDLQRIIRDTVDEQVQLAAIKGGF